MKKHMTIGALTSVLQAAFDEAYLSLLEAGTVSLDDELQHRLRSIIVPEVYGVLSEESERMGKRGVAMHDYFVLQAAKEVERRLKQELHDEEAVLSHSEPASAPLVLLPVFEGAER